jgi:hypothetical protein
MQQNRNRRVSAPREATGSSRGVKPCFVYMFDSSGSSRTAAVRGQQDGSMEHRRFGYLLTGFLLVAHSSFLLTAFSSATSAAYSTTRKCS